MATNKRKDAAALFELIDKSTLKVPKHAGALKIPDWWSSKSNPAPIAPPPPPAPPAPAKPAVEGIEPTKSAPTPSQPRLFDPPPATARPSGSPSIRPPAPASTRPATVPPQAPPPPSVATPPEAPSAPPAAVRRQFLPQTMAQGPDARPQWGGHQRRRMARTPKWAVLVGALLVVIVLSLIVYLVLLARKHSANKVSEPVAVQQPSNDTGTTLLPPMGAGSQAPIPGNSVLPPPTVPQPVTGGPLPAGQQAEEELPTEPGKVYEPRTVTRSPELYYLVISSTPTLSVARKSAEFLASKGVDVSIEIVASPNGKTRWYKLISVKGFATMVDAEPFRKEIVKIGHDSPDFKKYRKVWDDAFATHVTNVGK